VELQPRPMTDDEYDEWLPRLTDRYAEDMVKHAGATAERARAKAEADIEQLFPGERAAEGQIVFALESDGRRVGELWFMERDNELTGRVLWIYDIHVDEAFRRHGLGRAAMQFVEDEARRRGVDGIVLNVFGGNEAARSLYRSLGYEEFAAAMRKEV
jgi:ribosomal protein S18 acetylase RimI-like enzyme